MSLFGKKIKDVQISGRAEGQREEPALEPRQGSPGPPRQCVSLQQAPYLVRLLSGSESGMRQFCQHNLWGSGWGTFWEDFAS